MSISDCCGCMCVCLLIDVLLPQRSEIVTGKWCKVILVLMSRQWWLSLFSYSSQWQCFRKWQRFVCVPCCFCRTSYNQFFSLKVILFLQLLWQLMEYSYLLDQADKCEDPYMRMVYACKSLLLWVMKENIINR